MARRYVSSVASLSGAAMDVFQVSGVSNKLLYIVAVRISATNASPAAQQMALRCRVLPATVTSGTGGSTPAVVKLDPGDAAASFTVLAGNTTKATTSGTARGVHEFGAHISAGFDYMFPTPIPIVSGEAFVFELTAALTGTISLAASIEVEERG